jgi:hypothetical protein
LHGTERAVYEHPLEQREEGAMLRSNARRPSQPARSSVMRPRGPASRRPRTPRLALWLAALLAIAAQPRTGGAAVDMTGDWYTAFKFGPSSPRHFTQLGALLLTDGGSGGIDSATGAFTLVFAPSPLACGGSFQGQVDAAGNTFVATGSVFFPPQLCYISYPEEFRGSRAPCGNGVVDAGEQCDDGNLGRAPDCCALGCTQRPEGSDCSDGLFCNGEETTCQGGVCQRGVPPCRVACDEATDTCLSCPSEPGICRAANRSRLVVQQIGDASKHRLTWKWTQGAASSQTDFADPTSGTDYALCIFAGAGEELIGQAVVPADASKWSTIDATGYRYKDAAATAAGITRISLKGSTVSKSKVQVTGKGVALPDLPLPVTTPVVVELVNGTSGLCWEAGYGDTQLQKNETGELKAKYP